MSQAKPKRAEFESEALRQRSRARRWENASVLLSGLGIATSLALIAITVVRKFYPGVSEEETYLWITSVALIMWMPLAGLVLASKKLTQNTGEKQYRRELLAFLETEYPFDDREVKWASSQNTDHQLYQNPAMQENAILRFASNAFDRWHFYLAVAMLLVAVSLYVWFNPTFLASRPSLFVIGICILVFSVVFLSIRLACWALTVVPILSANWLLAIVTEDNFVKTFASSIRRFIDGFKRKKLPRQDKGNSAPVRESV